jgi:hypothetical protein
VRKRLFRSQPKGRASGARRQSIATRDDAINLASRGSPADQRRQRAKIEAKKFSGTGVSGYPYVLIADADIVELLGPEFWSGICSASHLKKLTGRSTNPMRGDWRCKLQRRNQWTFRVRNHNTLNKHF